MEEIHGPQNSNPESEDPLAPLSEDSAIIERVAEISGDSAPRKSVRQRLGSMAARRSVRRYGEADQPHIVEQAVIAEQGRFLRAGSNPRTT
ncbi:MAG TPA: hypothetical protein VHC21_01185 [Candidatus Saccharimonadales bacterium]|nr:hypothetical protein [Candidatus Saccharimonadales bacterium]